MNKIKLLNLYCGIGGNVQNLDRNVYDITSVEYDAEIASVYSKRFPCDNIIVGDALLFLKEHYNEYDFIWASPPCQTHCKSKRATCKDAFIVDMQLYQCILFLKTYGKGLSWCVENVVPWHIQFIPFDFKYDRHIYWCNYFVNTNIINGLHLDNLECATVDDLCSIYNVDKNILDGISFNKKRQMLRNMCEPVGSACIINQHMLKEIDLFSYFS